MEEVQVTNQSWLQNNTVGKIPMEVLNDAPIFPKSTIGTTIPWGYATGDQIITYKVGRATGKVGADPVRYDKLMAAFITNQITKKFTNEHDLLSSKTFADFAKNVTPKPGTIEEQWVKMAGDDLVQLVYSKVGFATTEPSQAAALPVNTPPVPPTNR